MMRRLPIAGALLAALILAGCSTAGGATTGGSTTGSATSGGAPATEAPAAGDIPDNQQYVPYTATSGAYSVSVPEGWSRSTDKGRVVFTDKLNGITVEETARGAAPTVQSVTSEDVPALTKSEPAFQLVDVAAFTRKGGSGILVKYLADSPVDKVTNRVVREAVERYLFWKNGVQVAVSLSGAGNADNVDPWKIVTESFTWLK